MGGELPAQRACRASKSWMAPWRSQACARSGGSVRSKTRAPRPLGGGAGRGQRRLGGGLGRLREVLRTRAMRGLDRASPSIPSRPLDEASA